MGFVCLHNLFDSHHNFYGRIPSDIQIVIEKDEHYYLLAKKSQKRFLDILDKAPRPINTFFSHDIDSPEWCLSQEGYLVNFTWPITVKGECITPLLFKINILHWLVQQNQ